METTRRVVLKGLLRLQFCHICSHKAVDINGGAIVSNKLQSTIKALFYVIYVLNTHAMTV